MTVIQQPGPADPQGTICPEASLNPEDTLISIGLLKQHHARPDVWLYRFNLDGGGWMTAKTKQGAIEEAIKTFDRLPPEQRITTYERDARAEASKIDALVKRYKTVSVDALSTRVASNRRELVLLNARKGALPLSANGTQRSASITAQLDALSVENREIGVVLAARG